MPAVLRPVRIDRELDEWFNATFPWRGSLPQFINRALAEFRREWGDRTPPAEILTKAMANMARNY